MMGMERRVRLRLVDFMTVRAIFLGHRFRVWLVTDRTLRDISMGIGVTEVTGEGGVLTRVSNELFIL